MLPLRHNCQSMVMKKNIYLRKIRKRERDWDTNVYPFSIPVIRDFTEFRFEKSVTYIVGGNGSGKSTLLEAIAVLLRINPEGGSRHFNFHTEETHSALHEALIASQASLSYNDTYFFRAESYYNVITEINRRGLNMYYDYLDFHEFSHGEGFMALLEQTEEDFPYRKYLSAGIDQRALLVKIRQIVETNKF